MRLLEFQGKRLLREYGIKIPKSSLVTSPSEVTQDMFPGIIKAQVRTGRRGKAGGVQHADGLEKGKAIAASLLGSNLLGETVSALLIEESIEFDRELFLALLIDQELNQMMIVGSGRGGIDIEEISQEQPDAIERIHVDPCLGLQSFALRRLARTMGLKDTAELSVIVRGMMELFTQNDATLVEINPLAVSKKGLVALDAKITLDDSAEFRHADLWPQLLQEHMEFVFAKQSKAERLARERRITYVPSQGNIGIIADGAGTGMYGFDIVSELGGKPANFCELGIGTSERMQNAIEVVLSNPRVEVLFITLIGGLTRMDEMADGIVGYLREKNVDLPVVVRMCGTQEEIGRAKLGTAGIDALDDLLLAAKRTVELSQRH